MREGNPSETSSGLGVRFDVIMLLPPDFDK